MEASKLFVPGMWMCPQCGFVQKNNVLSPVGVFAKTAPELRACPNDGRGMWPVTWEDHAKRLEESIGKVLDEQEGLRHALQIVYDLAPDLEKEGMENFEGYFCHWNQIIQFAAAHGVDGYAQSPMELLQRIVEQRDEAREVVHSKLLAVAEKCFITGFETAMGEEANYDSALKRWMESLIKKDLETECQQAPAGWQCTREVGHEGPCAAVESGVGA